MTKGFRHASIITLQVVTVCTLAANARAQPPQNPRMPAPPPMRFVSRTDRTQLDATKDAKTRLKSAIKLAEDRLTKAEALTAQKAFEEASFEIGGYLGLIGDLRSFIGALDKEKGSTRDIYRHMEIAVRAHIPRLAVMRRSTPALYSPHIKDAEEYIKDTRAEALDSFYGHSVLREPSSENANQPPDPSKRP